jgi:hypothetical protein
MASQRKSAGAAAKPGTPKGRGSSEIRLPGEKTVRATEKTVPVKRTRKGNDADEPVDPVSVDRRRQIVGTDDPGASPGRHP